MMPNQQLIETHFGLESGVLELLIQNEKFAPINNLIIKLYDKDKEFTNMKSNLESTLYSNSGLQKEIYTSENNLYKIEDQSSFSQLESKNIPDNKDSRVEVSEKKMTDTLKELREETANTDKLKDYIKELLVSIDNKTDQIANLNCELCEKERLLHISKIENRQLHNELENVKNNLKNNCSDLIMTKSMVLEERLREIQNKIGLTVEEYNDQLSQRDSDIEALKIELRCRDKHVELLKSEMNIINENKINVNEKVSEFSKKIIYLENDIHRMLSSLGERIDIIERYYRNQHDHNMEVGNKLSEYLAFINQLKSKLQHLEHEKSILTTELNDLKRESTIKVSEIEGKLNLSQKQLELFKCERSELELRDIMLDKDLLETCSPIALSTSKILTSGLTLTDIYSEYVKEHKELMNMKNENTMAATQLKLLLDELNAVKTSLNEQMNENSSMLSTNTTLSHQLRDARVECLDLKNVLKEFKVTNQDLESRLNHLEQVKEDLSGQIKTLLVRVEILVDKLPCDITVQNQTDNIPLPFFSSVSELQMANVKLLEMIHELDADLQKANNQIIELNEQVKINESDKCSLLESENKHVSKMLEITCQQRDMYRMLYQQKSGLTIDNDLLFTHLQHSESFESSLLEQDQLKNTCKDLRKQLNDISNNFSTFQLNANAEISELKNLKSKHLASLNEFEGKLKISKEQNKILKSNVQSLETKTNSLENLLSTLESSCEDLKNERDSILRELDAVKTAHRSLIIETDNFRFMLKRLEMENQILRDQAQTAHPLLIEFQHISNKLSSLDTLARSGLPSQLNGLRNEINYLRSQSTSLTSQFESEKIELTQNFENIKKELKKERSQHQSSVEKLHLLEERIESMKSSNLYALNMNEQPETVKVLVDSLKANIVDLETQVQQYKSIGENAEKKLIEFINEQNSLFETFNKEQNHWKALENDYNQRIESFMNEIAVYKKLIDPSQSTVSSSTVDELNQKIEDLSSSNQALSKQYDAAVVSHSETINRLKDAQLKIQKDEKIIQENNQKIVDLLSEIESLHLKLKDREVEFDNWEQSRRNDETVSKQQMETLYDQIKTLRDQLSNLSGNFQTSNSTSNDPSTDPTSDAWKLLEFTRRDKVILQGRLEFSQNENARLVTKCGQLQETISTLENSLKFERECKHSIITSSADLTSYHNTVKSLEKISLEKKDLDKKLSECKAKESLLKSQLEKVSLDHANLYEKYENLEKLYDSIVDKNDQLSMKNEFLVKKCSNLTEKINSSSNEDLMHKYQDLIESHSKCGSRVQEFTSKEASLKNKISELKQQLSSARNILAKRMVDIEKLKKDQKSIEECRYQPASSHIDPSQRDTEIDTEQINVLVYKEEDDEDKISEFISNQPDTSEVINNQFEISTSGSIKMETQENELKSEQTPLVPPLTTTTLERRLILPPAVQKSDEGRSNIIKKSQSKTTIIRTPSILRSIINPGDISATVKSTPLQTKANIAPVATSESSLSQKEDGQLLDQLTGKRFITVNEEVKDPLELGEISEVIPAKRRIIFSRDNSQSTNQFAAQEIKLIPVNSMEPTEESNSIEEPKTDNFAVNTSISVNPLEPLTLSEELSKNVENTEDSSKNKSFLEVEGDLLQESKPHEGAMTEEIEIHDDSKS